MIEAMAVDWVTTSLVLEQLRDFKNEAAWGRLAECFQAPLVAFAEHMGLLGSDAEDVAQETLLAFACGYREGKYDPTKGRLSQWIFGIAYRQIQGARRTRARRNARMAGESAAGHAFDDLPGREEATRTWGEECAKSLLARCLRTIRTEVQPKTYRAFELTVFEKRAASDVALELGVSRNAVFKAKHRIVRRIRELQLAFESLN